MGSKAVNSGENKTKHCRLTALCILPSEPWLRLKAANIYRFLSPRLMLWYMMNACVHKCMHAPGEEDAKRSLSPLTRLKLFLFTAY